VCVLVCETYIMLLCRKVPKGELWSCGMKPRTGDTDVAVFAHLRHTFRAPRQRHPTPFDDIFTFPV